ncbi:MAG: chromate transporter [Lachnospiraceae bacterium]|nr:chromate transporter [Lachnospiraceae bacterium]
MIYWQLFETFFLIGLFGYGGGDASMELIRSRVVLQRAWMTGAEFTDVITISEMTPGPMGINIASFVGIRVGGVPGTVVATLSYVLPSLVIVMIFAGVYFKYQNLRAVQGVLAGLRPAVVAMIAVAMLRLAGNAFWGGIERISFANTNWAAILVIFASGVIGALVYGFAGI